MALRAGATLSELGECLFGGNNTGYGVMFPMCDHKNKRDPVNHRALFGSLNSDG